MMQLHLRAFRISAKGVGVFCVGMLLLGSLVAYIFWYTRPLLNPFPNTSVTEYHRTLDLYSFFHLSQRVYSPSPIKLEKVLEITPTFTVYLFTFQSDGATVSGQLNLPKKAGKLPVIVMLRGFVDKEIYATGIGTRRAAEVYAQNGYITIAPDFLGYGSSSPESFDIWEARFEKPVTVLNLLASLNTLPQADLQRIGLWGHSNGGQIALSILEITKKSYPTVLWAPVSKGFPDSVLQFIGDLPDKGAYILGELETFKERYREQDYSIADHFTNIQAEIKDDAVPLEWSDTLHESLTQLEKQVQYYRYPGADHNFAGGAWSTVVQRDLVFFSRTL
jgi:dipeptidyl aminopeptidase/acylaminoacyl peptidase